MSWPHSWGPAGGVGCARRRRARRWRRRSSAGHGRENQVRADEKASRGEDVQADFVYRRYAGTVSGAWVFDWRWVKDMRHRFLNIKSHSELNSC